MSAYMVDREHIAFLLDAAMDINIIGNRSFHWYVAADRRRCSIHAGDWRRAAEVGQMLWNENRKSIEARYPDTVVNFCASAPGPVGETFVYDKHNPNIFHRCDPVQVIKACRCFDYQACEYEGWKTSEAKSFIDALMLSALSHLRGYDDAEWGAPKSYYEQVA